MRDTTGEKSFSLIAPYKGALVDLFAPEGDRAGLFEYALGLPSVRLTLRQTCDLEVMAVGGFSPLRTFMSARDLECVLTAMRLADGTVFPIPITLSVDEPGRFSVGGDIALRDPKNEVLAILTIDEVYEWDKAAFTAALCGNNPTSHPLASEIGFWGRFNISGEIHVLKLPDHFDFREIRLTPMETRRRLAVLGRQNVVAFQTRNPIHRAHEAVTLKAINGVNGTLLLHPAVGLTQEGDIDHFSRVRSYWAAVDHAYPQGRVVLSLLPLAMRMAGPREAVWHAVIRRNYGASHFIVGRDHASPRCGANGERCYEPEAAQDLARKFSSEIGVEIIDLLEIVYVHGEDRYEEIGRIPRGKTFFRLSGARIREEYLEKGAAVPEWMMRREIADTLHDSCSPKFRQGVCVWFTGLSCAGKSTTAEILSDLLLAEGRQCTLLDGDIVRMNLSKGLGFSREDRETNIRRISFVASEVVRHGGIAICAAISPYREVRRHVRQMFSSGRFVEVFVDTPLAVCEARDTKGLYKRARRGEISSVSGVDDVYEPPSGPEIALETEHRTAEENAWLIVGHLRELGFLKPRGSAARHH